MHLTKYVHATNFKFIGFSFAINKKSKDFISSSDANAGSKRSLAFIWKWLQENGHSPDAVWADISDVINLTLLSILPRLVEGYRGYFRKPAANGDSSCFEILGFDIMLDNNVSKTYLLDYLRNFS